MRQVIINSSITKSDSVEKVAQVNHAILTGKVKDEDKATYIYTFENNHLEKFLRDIKDLEEIRVSFSPNEIVLLETPFNKVTPLDKGVKEKSGVEVYLSGWQSVGSYLSFLSYSFAAGIVTWIALYTNTIYLLIGGMLIAPYAAAALTTAIGSSSGDINLIKKGALRYLLSLFIGFLTSVLLTMLFPVMTYSSLMLQTSRISSVTMLLPMVAGWAGAVGLINSERNNLVSGAAYGLLISASLAPQSALLGISATIGEVDGIISSVFLLLLQLIVIHLTASLVFRFYGKMQAERIAFPVNAGKAFWYSTAFAFIAGVALLYWQFNSKPDLQKSSIESEIVSIIKTTTDSIPQIDLVEAKVKFTRSKEKDLNPILCEIYIIKLEQYFNPNDFTEYTNLLIKTRLKEAVKEKIRSRNLKVHPIFKIEFVSS